jgi:hypothetical protein
MYSIFFSVFSNEIEYLEGILMSCSTEPQDMPLVRPLDLASLPWSIVHSRGIFDVSRSRNFTQNIHTVLRFVAN